MDTEYVVTDVTSLDDIKLMDKAKQIGEVLNHEYPGHMWVVSWQGGALVVKNLAISGHYGFILRDDPDPKVLSHNAMLAGGELLERAKMFRGEWDGQFAKELEGSSKQWFNPM
jgi:hypothetical protein